MLCRIYIEALLVDEDLADQVQEKLEAGEIDDRMAFLAWLLIAFGGQSFTALERQATAYTDSGCSIE